MELNIDAFKWSVYLLLSLWSILEYWRSVNEWGGEGGAEGWSCTLYRRGARVLPPIKYSGEEWRILKASTLHSSLSHLLGNVLGQAWLLFESASVETVWIAMYGMVCGHLFSVCLQPHVLGVGSSGATMALLGLLTTKMLIQLWLARSQLSRKQRMLSAAKIALPIIYTICIQSTGQDVHCHLFALAAGCLIAGLNFYPVSEKDETWYQKFKISSRILLTGVPLCCLGYIIFIYGGNEELAAALLDMGC